MRQNFEEEPLSLSEYLNILKRRRFLFGLPAIAIVIFTVFYVLGLPATYRSEATILIEDQEIPEDIIGATLTNYASQQIELISQRLFTVESINDFVDKFDIYQMKGQDYYPPPAEVARWFRNDL
jgi:succinoglycan biosynthesis transport protein ExoP